jgi:3-phosphoshikimate 1-carboxyvinyltransferase
LNSFPVCEKNTEGEVIDLYTGDGGTTNRFLIALLSCGNKTYRIFPSEKIIERPIEDLLLPLRELDVRIELPESGPWITIKGPANTKFSKSIILDCAKSTQFATAMLLIFHDTAISFSFKNLNSSETYLQMTEQIIKENSNSYKVPADFSSISYPVALALVGGAVNITNCMEQDPYQADSMFIDLLLKIGGDISFTSKGLYVASQKPLNPFVVDGSQCPDLVPTLAFLASRIEGESRLENLAVLRHKESDRIEEILKLLETFQVDHTFNNERSTLTIRGSKKLSPSISYCSARDHRMVMTAYLFMRANNGGLLGNTDCVKKSYPRFFEDLE